MFDELPIEPPEPRIRAETRCQICGEPVDDYSRWSNDSYLYIIGGYRFFPGSVGEWGSEKRVGVYDLVSNYPVSGAFLIALRGKQVRVKKRGT